MAVPPDDVVDDLPSSTAPAAHAAVS
jgi:hypothetical protein